MIKPTVGRIVHYYSPCALSYDIPPLAAIITGVLSDTCVTLAIFDDRGLPYTKPPTSVLLVQPEAEPPQKGGFCQWMPYQVKKTTGSESGERSAGSESI